MILVDTSVWVRFLRGAEPFASGLEEVLSRDEVCGHEMVYGELLIGDPSGRSKLLSAYALMHQLPTVRHAEVAQFVRDRRLSGRGIGWVDAHLLASAVLSGERLWSADKRLVSAAEALAVAYRPGHA